MKVICPKCQFENQADSTRIVCARCATIIEVKQDPGAAGLEGNGKRQTARLPFVGNVGNSQPLNNPLNNPPANAGRDVYATRIGDDFDDVLDIPRQAQPSYQAGPMNQPGNEPTTAFEDVFAMPNYDAPPGYDFPPQERKPTAPVEGFPTGPNRQRATQDYDESPEPEFMGWPVLPENADYETDQAGAMGSNRGALLIRIGLGVLVFGLLSVAAYFLLGDKIAKRQAEFNDRVASGNSEANAGSTYPPATLPSIEAKPPSPSSEPAKPQDQTPAVANNAKQIEINPTTGKTGHSPSPKPAPQTEQPVAATPSNGNLTIQVASFNDQAQANERVNWLRSKGAEARAVKVEIPNKGTWYRVQIGGFKSREEANGYATQLRSKGILQDFIVTTVGK